MVENRPIVAGRRDFVGYQHVHQPTAMTSTSKDDNRSRIGVRVPPLLVERLLVKEALEGKAMVPQSAYDGFGSCQEEEEEEFRYHYGRKVLVVLDGDVRGREEGTLIQASVLLYICLC